MQRCAWVGKNKPYYEYYHDTEWGIPVHADQKHFEMLTLEGAQAGLSWETILKRREGYRQAFKGFDVHQVAVMTEAELSEQLNNPNIIRNRLKIFSVRQNAQVFINIQQEYGTFDTYVWRFVNHNPKLNRPAALDLVPVHTTESDLLSKDLKKRGMKFVGSTIIYAYMQAIGMVNDHTMDCFCCPK